MSGPASVSLRGIVKRHGETTVLHGVDLDIGAGEFFVLLGPSGSGKTTTLRILAGLEAVSEGRVSIDGQDVTQTQPGERDVAMVFQSYALYPHMTVAENIAFPLRMVGRPQAEIERQVADAARRVGIGHLLARRPGQLSGGQQQRVALARAIVRQPRLFLLDEPLSNLDAKLRLETRLELRQLQRGLGVTTVYVTHDQEEAMTLADRIAVFMDGRIVQVGTPREVFGRPMSASVAGFIGTPPMNLLAARWDGTRVGIEGAGAVALAGLELAPGDVTLGVRPADLRLAGPGLEVGAAEGPAQGQGEGQQGGFAARVEYVEDLGDHAVVNLRVADTRVKLKADAARAPREGETVRLNFAPGAAHLFDRADGRRLG